MAWSTSRIGTIFTAKALTTDVGNVMDANALKVAFFNDTVTPDHTAGQAAYQFGGSQWPGSAQVFEAGTWGSGGANLQNVVVSTSGGTVTLTADDVSTLAGFDTSSDIHGVLVYMPGATPANLGLCHNYLGQGWTVVNGTFEVQWSGSGILAIDLG